MSSLLIWWSCPIVITSPILATTREDMSTQVSMTPPGMITSSITANTLTPSVSALACFLQSAFPSCFLCSFFSRHIALLESEACFLFAVDRCVVLERTSRNFKLYDHNLQLLKVVRGHRKAVLAGTSLGSLLYWCLFLHSLTHSLAHLCSGAYS